MPDKKSAREFSNELLEELSRKMAALFPAAGNVRRDIESGIRDLLQENLARLNLLTRDEMEQQFRVLQRAEQAIARLEARIAELERQLAASPPSAPTKSDQTSGS